MWAVGIDPVDPLALDFGPYDTREGRRVSGLVLWPGCDGLEATIDEPGAPPVPVLGLSPLAIALRSKGSSHFETGCRITLRLQLGHREAGPFVAEVVRVGDEGPGGARSVAARFVEPDLPKTRDLFGIIVALLGRGPILAEAVQQRDEEAIEDPERIRRILAALDLNECEGVVTFGQGARWPVRAVPRQLDSSLPLQWDYAGPPVETPCVVVMTGFHSLYRFTVDRVRLGEGLLAASLPRRIIRLGCPWHRSIAAPPGYRVAFRHPLWPEIEVRQQVCALSQGGFSFPCEPDQDCLFPGVEIPVLEVSRHGTAVWTGGGRVESLAWDAGKPASCDPREVICTLRMRPESRAAEARWLDLVNPQLHPRTAAGATWSDHAWEVFEESGYFNLSGKTPAQFRALKRSFTRVGRLIGDYHPVGCRAVWPSGRGIEATVTTLKVHHGTWLGYQTAKRRQTGQSASGGRILLDIHLRALEHVMLDPDFRWLVAYVQKSAKWPRVAYFDFAQRHAATGQTLAYRFRVMEAHRTGPAVQRPHGIDVTAPEPTELDAFFGLVARTRPAPYVDLLDLTPERFELRELAATWAKAGLHRERACLVARHAGRPIALAVLETGDDGLHLFNLLDILRLYPLAEDPDPGYVALLDAARGWFFDRGKDSFAYFVETADITHAKTAGLRDLGEADMVAYAAEIYPAFIDHLFEISAPRVIGEREKKP